MATETRICQNAINGLKKNSTKLLIAMSFGIALALYGAYVQTRSLSNPAYMPTLSMATHWLYDILGQKLVGRVLKACAKAPVKQAVPHLMMRTIVHPIVHYSAIMSGAINLVQIVLLKLYGKKVSIVDVIIAMSASALLLSAVCIVGAFASCRTMCITCLGIHHVFIIYYSICRRGIIKNMTCPPSSNSDGPCSFGSNKIFGTSSANRTGNSSSEARRRSGR